MYNYKKFNYSGIIFVSILISILLFIFANNNGDCSNCHKKEGMINNTESSGRIISGQMVGTLRHAMSPAISSAKRNVRTTITNAFSNPDVQYYTNKLQQIFR